MSYRPSQLVPLGYTIHSGGVATDPDALPTATLLENGTDSGVTVTVASVSGTGRHTYSFTIPSDGDGKTYQLRIEATIGGSEAEATIDLGVARAAGVTVSDFTGNAEADIDGIKAKTDLITTAGGVTVQNAVSADGSRITLVVNDDHTVAAGQQLDFDSTIDDEWPDLTGATVTLRIYNVKTGVKVWEKTGTVVTPTGSQRVRVEPEQAETTQLTNTEKLYRFNLRAALSGGNVVTLRGSGNSWGVNVILGGDDPA